MDIINNSGLNKFPTAGTTVPLQVAYKPPPRTTQDSAKQQVNRQQRSSNDSSLNCQLRTHQWQQHQHITTNVHHYHHRKEHYRMKLQRVRRQSKQDDKKHQQVWQDQKQQQNQQHPNKGLQQLQSKQTRDKKSQQVHAKTPTNTDDLTWAGHQGHRSIGQTTDDTRNEEGSSADETTECIHRSAHRHTDTRTTKEHHTEQMGPTQQRKRGASTHRGTDIDNIFASTPIYSVLLILSLNNNWTVRTGDISVAFLHAAAATDDLHMYPPTEFTTKQTESFGSSTEQSTAWEAHQKLGKHI